MKRYLLAGGLSLTLLLATGSLALAQDDTDDVEDSEEVQSLLETIAELEAMIEALEAELAGDDVEDDAVEEDVDADDDGDDKGTRQNPYAVGEVGTIAVITHQYDDPFSTQSMARDDSDVVMTEEEVMEEDVMTADEELSILEQFIDMGMGMNSEYDMARMYYPPYNSRVFEGEAEMEFTEVLRGDEALDFLNERNFYDYSTVDDSLEWAVFNFTFEWTESDDPNSMHFSSYEFNVFDSTGVSVNAQDYYTYFDGAFESNELYVGGVLNGTIAKLVPEGEPFMMRIGDNYWMQHTFFEFDAE